MNIILLFTLIILGIASVLIISVKRLFRNSISSVIGVVGVMIAGTMAILAFTLGIIGLINIFWLAPIAIVILLSCIYYLDKVLIKPMGAITFDIVENLSRGNLHFSFNKKLLSRKDELGKISNALEDMRRKLNTIMEEVTVISGIILQSANEQSLAAQTISQGASEQASSIEEVSSSIEEMKANLELNLQNAKKAASISGKAAKEISLTVEASSKSVTSIGEIASKISIINDIAFQTNLLALNAAVEAARAGEQGKGFAVVAGEVRKLAERSKIAAENINVLASSSVSLTNESGQKMEILAPEIKTTSLLIQEISTASMEQNLGAEQINNSIIHLNQVTQQNAATAEQMASGAEELANNAKRLSQTLEYFK